MGIFVHKSRYISVSVLLSLLLINSTATAQEKWDRVEDLLIENDCRRLGVLYSHYVDLNQAEKVADLFSEAGVFSIGDVKVIGRQAIRALFVNLQNKKDYISKHLLSNESIVRKSDKVAVGRSYVTVYNYPMQVGSESHGLHAKSVAAAQYEDQYILSEKGCLIKYRKVVPVFVRKQSSIQ